MPRLDRIDDPDVAAVFAAAPPRARRTLRALRALILRTARALDDVGPIEETLKWGEPAYLPSATKSGSTIRLGWKPAAPDEVRLLVHCQTDLVSRFRTLFPELRTEGKRAIVLGVDDALPEDALSVCVEMALRYHRSKGR